jgi:hypothetical protein
VGAAGGRAGAPRPGRVGFRAAPDHPPEVPLPLWLSILLGVFWLAVLVTVAFTVWRLVANLKALTASLQVLGERLTPVLEELADASQETAGHAERVSERAARLSDQGGRKRPPGPPRPG